VDFGRSLLLGSRLDRLRRPHSIEVTSAPSTSTEIVRGGWLIATFSVGVQTAAHLINAFALGHAHPAFDAAVDRSAFDWMSFCGASIAALALVFLAISPAPYGRSAAILALLVVFLAVDDLTNLHDHIGNAFAHTLPAPLDRVGDWSTPVLYLPLLVATFGLLWSYAKRVAPEPGRQMRTALALLAGAIALRLLVGILEIGGFHAPETIRVMGLAVLEGSELGAWILVGAALVAEGADVLRQASPVVGSAKHGRYGEAKRALP
jgi:hypothetical protein